MVRMLSDSRLRACQHLGSTPPLPHHADELVVLPPRPLDPQDIVEQELVVVCGRQALETQVRSVDDHLAEAPDLGVDAQIIHAGSPEAGIGTLDVCATTFVPAV